MIIASLASSRAARVCWTLDVSPPWGMPQASDTRAAAARRGDGDRVKLCRLCRGPDAPRFLDEADGAVHGFLEAVVDDHGVVGAGGLGAGDLFLGGGEALLDLFFAFAFAVAEPSEELFLAWGEDEHGEGAWEG